MYHFHLSNNCNRNWICGPQIQEGRWPRSPPSQTLIKGIGGSLPFLPPKWNSNCWFTKSASCFVSNNQTVWVSFIHWQCVHVSLRYRFVLFLLKKEAPKRKAFSIKQQDFALLMAAFGKIAADQRITRSVLWCAWLVLHLDVFVLHHSTRSFIQKVLCREGKSSVNFISLMQKIICDKISK